MFESWTLTNISNRKWWIYETEIHQPPTCCFHKILRSQWFVATAHQQTSPLRVGAHEVLVKPREGAGRAWYMQEGFEWIVGWRIFCWRNLRKIYKGRCDSCDLCQCIKPCNFDWKTYSIMGIGEVFQILCVCCWNFHAPGQQGYQWYDMLCSQCYWLGNSGKPSKKSA